MPGGNSAIGTNYLGLCDTARGAGADSAAAVGHGIRAVMQRRCAEFILEYPCDGPNEERWFVVRATRFAGDGPARVVVAHENITTRRRMEAELRQKTALLEAQLNTSIDGILVVDERGRKILQNQRLSDLLNIPQSIADDPDDEAQLLWVTGAAKSPEEFLSRVRYLNSHPLEVSRDELAMKDGKILDRYSSPMTGGDGTYLGRVWTFRDITERKRVEEALRQSKEQFRQLADHIQDVFWICSPDLGAMHFASPGYERIWGRSVESLYAHPHQWLEAILPDDLPRTASAFSALGSDAPLVSVEYRIARPDGTIRWIHDRGFQVRDAEGNLVSLTGVASDITERKAAVEALREREERYRALIETTGTGFSILDGNGFVLDANVEYVRLTGNTDRGAILGHSVLEWTSVNQRKASEEQLRRCIARGSVRGLEVCFEDGRGNVVPVEINATLIRTKEGDRILSLVRDITERKQAAERQRDGAQRLQLLWQAIDNSPATIVITDQWGSIEYVNPQFTATTGYSREEAIGRNPRILKSDKTPPAVYKSLWGTLQAGDNWCGELCNRKKDGTLFWESSIISPVKDGDGKTVKYIAIKENITERKMAEAELLDANRKLESATIRANEMAARAERASGAKSEFLTNMSHEIRTPLNGVIGMAALLLNTELTANQRGYAEILRASGASLLGLVNDILDLSKIEANKLGLETLDFDLSEMLDEFADSLALRAQEKGLELLCSVEPPVLTLLRGDPGRLRQVLSNLAGNAIKFTHDGEVAVGASLAEDGPSGVLLRFTVRDTGIGIPKDKMQLLFNKFSQLDSSTSRKYGGTGLGLAISKQLIRLMGGEIGASSDDGKGSEFWFTARFAKQPGVPQARHGAPEGLGGIRALVVDDNKSSRESLVSCLASWGMRPSGEAGGPGALASLGRAADEDDPFKVAVIDMRMPGMDGEALGRAIRADQRFRGTRMVMLTSLCKPADLQQIRAIGFSSLSAKPIRKGELSYAISTALGVAAGAAPTSRSGAPRVKASNLAGRFVGRKARILLAEDNATNQQVALGMLGQMGLSADPVPNGAEAVRALERIPYDLVLMDLQMPVMAGFESTRRIRDEGSAVLNHRVPVIAMTAHAIQGDRERCLAEGMNDYVSKPVSTLALADVLDRWLPPGPAAVESLNARAACAPPPDTARDGEAPVFDLPTVMSRMMDDDALVRKVIAGFLGDMPKQLAVLRSLVDAGDAPSARVTAHAIKGAAANVGGERMRESAQGIERAATAGDLASAKALLADLNRQFDALSEAMNAKAAPGKMETAQAS
jgi:PAS domain S-box-containing protein